MAYATNELFSSNTPAAPTRTIARETAPKNLAAGAGTLAVNTPMAFNTATNFWVPWTNGGANGTGVLKGILFPDAAVLDAGGEVIAHVLIRGIVHADDVKAASAEADADVEAILRTEARLLGIEVQGLDQVR